MVDTAACCGGGLQRGAKIIACLQIIWYSVIFIVNVTFIGYFVIYNPPAHIQIRVPVTQEELDNATASKTYLEFEKDENDEPYRNIDIYVKQPVLSNTVIFLAVKASFCFMYVMVAISLLNGIKKKSPGRCMSWLKWNKALLCLKIIMIMSYGILFFAEFFRSEWLILIFVAVVVYIIDAYFIWVVDIYRTELVEENENEDEKLEESKNDDQIKS